METPKRRPGPAPIPFDAPRTCPKCEKHLPADDFPRDRSRVNGRYPYCKPCKARLMRETTAKRRSDGRMDLENLTRSLKLYGVDHAWHSEQLARTGGTCEICGGPPTGNHKRLVIDHRHSTGKARGLLCGNCNTAIGKLKDSPQILRAAAAYLERNGHDGP